MLLGEHGARLESGEKGKEETGTMLFSVTCYKGLGYTPVDYLWGREHSVASIQSCIYSILHEYSAHVTNGSDSK